MAFPLPAQFHRRIHRATAVGPGRAGLGRLHSPFVGLFGTVRGIYHSLLSISEAGQATIDKVAGPIGGALIMTALGLAVAIPAALGNKALVRGNKAVLLGLKRFAHDRIFRDRRAHHRRRRGAPRRTYEKGGVTWHSAPKMRPTP